MRLNQRIRLSEFHQRTMHPDETPQKYLYELKRLLQKAFPEMFEGAREQLLFEQYIRGLPRYVYENIRVSPDVKTTEDALKRAQVVIRMHSENSNQDLDGVAAVSIGKESKQEEEKIKCEKGFSQEAIDAAVKAITEKMTLTNTDRSDYACTIQRGIQRGGRIFSEGRKPRELRCFACGGRGHYAQACPSSSRTVRKQLRCYNCDQLGHVMKYCQEPPIGHALNSRGPVGRAETRSQRL